MHIFMARQPIFDKNNNVVAYELLFRNGCENVYDNVDGDEATLNVIANLFYEFNFKIVTDNKKAFVNFTEKLIKEEVAAILPQKHVVIEMLESIEPTDEIINACKDLKKHGFILALDDFTIDDKYNKLVEIIDIIKVDFITTKGYDRKKVFNLLKTNKKIKFLAEKVETFEEYNEAMNYGYTYFQGYYFSKPVILSTKSVSTSKSTALKILKSINDKNINFNYLEALILKDPVLSYKLIKLINSSMYYIKHKVDSIKYALTFFGEREMIKWLHIVLLNDLKGNNPPELVKISLERAKFCELICEISEYKEKAFLAYMTGLFSVMDAILNCSMDTVMKDIYLCDEMKEALTGKENILNTILKLSVDFGRGDWKEAEVNANKINIDINKIPDMYLKVLNWVDNVVCK